MVSNQRAFENEALKKGFRVIAGIDEAGRGPLAGPVVSATVVLPDFFTDEGITDSKKLTPKKRNVLFDRIYDDAVSVGVGIVDVGEIDRINILQASLLSMAISVENLQLQPDFLLIDGIFPINSKIPQRPIPKGDSLSVSIAAASIIAKVTRDRIMADYNETYPDYGFSKHKGYPTVAHKAAIRQFGPCPIHRRTFKGVKEYLQAFHIS
ncbi:MAG: ribonuclease HII [Desulfobacterales bacterium]|nr:ribonuclease HII [Desulfobacterales bacterium]